MVGVMGRGVRTQQCWPFVRRDLDSCPVEPEVEPVVAGVPRWTLDEFEVVPMAVVALLAVRAPDEVRSLHEIEA